MTTSPWQAYTSSPSIETDLLIVGGGIVGLSAMHHAADAGVRVLLLEQKHIAYGASGRNAGYLMTGADDNYAAAIRAWGRDDAKRMWRLSQGTLEGLRRLGVDRLPGYAPCPSCLVPMSDSELDDLHASHELMAADGFEAELLESPCDDAFTRNLKPSVTLVQHGDAVCDPAEVCRHIASRAPQGSILERTRFISLAQHNDILAVRTSGPTVHTSRVLFATNAYSGSVVEELRTLIAPHRAQMMSIEALPGEPELRRAYYLDRGSEYIRQHRDRILVGGWRKYHANQERTLEDSITDQVQGGLERFAERVLGRSVKVVDRWSGPMGFTQDHQPVVGPILKLNQQDDPFAELDPEVAARVWVCAGFTGHGMSLGFGVANEAVRGLLGS